MRRACCGRSIGVKGGTVRRTLMLGAVAVVVAAVGGCGGGETSACKPVVSRESPWVICDLGTLGGEFSEAVAINDDGQIVGSADTERSKQGRRIAHAFLWEKGKMRDLGTLPGFESGSQAVAINDRGQVVGSSLSGASDKHGRSIWHAFLWQKGTMRDLGTLGGPSSSAYAINERGQVVGAADTKVIARSGHHVTHAFLWQDGRMIDLGSLGGSSGALAINEHDQGLGSSDVPNGTRAVLWEKGRMTNLGTLPDGYNSYPGAINDQGQIVGKSSVASHYWHAFLWQKGRMIDLNIPPANRDSEAVAINNRGQVIGTRLGWSRTLFLWDHGQRTDLRIRPLGSDPIQINERGQIVGTTGSNVHAFLWEGGRIHDLGTLGGDSSHAVAINEHDQITGTSYTAVQAKDVRGQTVIADGPSHAVLWTLRSG